MPNQKQTNDPQNRPDLVRRALPLLPPDTQIRQIFICQTAPYFWLFVINYLTFLTIFWITFYCVVVTDDAIYVLESTKFSGGGHPKAVVARLPRNTQLGPVSGRWGEINLMGKRCWVHKRFHALVAAADSAVGFTG